MNRYLRDKLNPADQTPIKAPAKRGVQGTSPPIVSIPRPMPPAPPRRVDIPNRRGVSTSPAPVDRPMTPHARELQEKARHLYRPRLCAVCGGTNQINVVKNKKNQTIKWEACPKCVDCEAVYSTEEPIVIDDME